MLVKCLVPTMCWTEVSGVPPERVLQHVAVLLSPYCVICALSLTALRGRVWQAESCMIPCL